MPSSHSYPECSVFVPNLPEGSCITFIGMAGAGKTTIGRMVAKALGWAFADTDHIIESLYAAPLQSIADSLSKDAFIEMEAEVISGVRLCRTVIATGGSVVYRQSSMDHLASMGPVVYLDVPMDVILERIARNPDRGLAIAPGQTVEELFLERIALYRRYATLTVPCQGMSPNETTRLVLEKLTELPSSAR